MYSWSIFFIYFLNTLFIFEQFWIHIKVENTEVSYITQAQFFPIINILYHTLVIINIGTLLTKMCKLFKLPYF